MTTVHSREGPELKFSVAETETEHEYRSTQSHKLIYGSVYYVTILVLQSTGSFVQTLGL